MNKKVILNLFFMIIISYSFFGNDLTRKYYNNVFHGGKEKLQFFNEEGQKNINIHSSNIVINLYENYVKVNILYEFNCENNDTKLIFMYPKIDSYISKNIYTILEKGSDDVKTKNQQYKIEGNYEDFKIMINKEEVKYQIEKSDLLEMEIPYKLGDEKEYSDNEFNLYKESIESYTFLYGWYTIPLEFKKKENKKIQISYKCNYYYNKNVFNKTKSLIEIEDPALKYDYIENDNECKGISEKIFTYNFFTSYSQGEKTVDTTYIKIISHLIDRNYLKILPTNFKKSGISYSWKYKKLKAKQLNNITLSILPSNSERMISLENFKISPSRKINDTDPYYEINRKNENILLEYSGDKEQKKSVYISEIRIVPEYYSGKDLVKKSNKPLEFEILFSMKEDFSDAKRYTKKLKEKNFNNLLNKTSYISIFKDKPVECKYIKIKILKVSGDNIDIIKIRDIEILE